LKQVRGLWFPDTDEHLVTEVSRSINPIVDGRGTYQLNKYNAALKHVRRKGHAVDIGANIGLWSRIMERDFALVTAIEPVASHCECFRKNVKRTKVRQVALGSEPGRVMINVPPLHVASAHVSDEGEEVELVTLDSLKLGRVDFVKIDVEGYEFDVVRGGENLIRMSRPVIIVEQKEGNAERYGIRQRDAVDQLAAWGMQEVACIGGDHVMVFP
jgi:FkbM family methyltransferase